MQSRVLSFILAFSAALMTGQTSFALLDGKVVVKVSSRHPVVALKILAKNEITRCTATFVSKNTILTAAHCFDQMVKSCSSEGHCQASRRSFSLNTNKVSLWIDNKPVTASYTLLRHPRYASTEDTGYENYDQSNNDLALVILSKVTSPKSFVRIANSLPRQGTAWVYGAGMTRAKLFSNPNTGEAYNLESDVGPLKKQGTSVRQVTRKKGLLEVSSSITGYPSEPNLYDLSSNHGLQVLSADSGGPLIHDNKLIGVIRNFSFSFTPTRQPASIGSPFSVKGRSIFTSLTSSGHTIFFDTARKYGGAVLLEK